MRGRVVRNETSARAMARSPEYPRNRERAEMDIALHASSRRLPTIWKKPLCGASDANWNRRAWPVAGKGGRCRKSFGVRKKGVATIRAPVALERNLKSATEHKASLGSAGNHMGNGPTRPSS